MRAHVFKYRTPEQQMADVNAGKLSILALDFEHYGGGPITYRQHKAAALRKEALRAPAKFCILKRRKR